MGFTVFDVTSGSFPGKGLRASACYVVGFLHVSK